jgi:hypothetical protein
MIRKVILLVSGPDDLFHGRKIGAHPVDRFAEAGIGNQHPDPGIVHDQGKLPGGEPVVQRYGGCAYQGNRIIGLQKIMTIGMQDGNPVALFHSLFA